MVRADATEGNVAILIDFENAKDAELSRVIAEATRFGRVIVRRAYADWTNFTQHAAQLREAGFEEVHQFTSGGRGKNATDIHLVVDAMDLMYTRPLDTFVLVTADSDFAKLARRLREGGKRIIGLGARGRVGRALVQSCDEYIYYDVEPRRQKKKPAKKTEPPKEKDSRAKSPPAKAEPKPALTDLHYFVLDAMDAASDDSGDVYGGPLHDAIRRIHPDFRYRDYGFNSFRRFIESLAPVIRAKHADDVSDFIVWVEPKYEDLVEEERDAKRDAERARSAAVADDRPATLAEDVQNFIDKEWRETAGGRKRLSGRRAAEVVSREYGVTRLSDTPVGSLDGVLEAAPILNEKWKREGAWLVPRK